MTRTNGDFKRMDIKATLPSRLPEHLPRRLTMSFWYHDWLSAVLSGAPFDELEC